MGGSGTYPLFYIWKLLPSGTEGIRLLFLQMQCFRNKMLVSHKSLARIPHCTQTAVLIKTNKQSFCSKSFVQLLKDVLSPSLLSVDDLFLN